MATLASQQITRAGLNPTMSACSGGGDEFVNSGLQFVKVVNTNAAARTVTIATQSLVDVDLTVSDRDISVGATSTRMIGPFKPAIYNDGNGKVQLTYSSVVDMTIAVLELGSQ